MAEIMLQVIALGLEDVVVFVFDLPSPATRLGHIHDVVRRQAMIGDTAVVIELLACFGVGNGKLKPIDGQGTVTTTQEHVVEVAHHGHFREAAIPVAHCTFDYRVGGLPKG